MKEDKVEIFFKNIEDIKMFFDTADLNLRSLEDKLNIKISLKENSLILSGKKENLKKGKMLIEETLSLIEDGIAITPDALQDLIISSIEKDEETDLIKSIKTPILLDRRGYSIFAKTIGQKTYIDSVLNSDLTFVIGPAGTGKTYLGVALAVKALKEKWVDRIILTRPVIEAGEKLGFLPGDIKEKVDPYFRPIFDALFDFFEPSKVEMMIEKKIIEIAPLAYMRGRTLNNGFIILDEAQNTTVPQIKMFLTRFGRNSKVVVTGDITQIDLPKGEESGLKVAQRILNEIEGVSFVYLTRKDVVRHHLVKVIIDAFENYMKS